MPRERSLPSTDPTRAAAGVTAPRIVASERNLGIATWHNVVIAIVQDQLDPRGVRAIADTYNKLYEAFPTGLSGITVLRSKMKVGSPETNAEAQNVLAEVRDKLLHVCVAIENRGVLAQLLSAVIRTFNSITRTARISIAVDIEGAARSVAPYVVVADGSAKLRVQQDLVAAIEILRRACPEAEA